MRIRLIFCCCNFFCVFLLKFIHMRTNIEIDDRLMATAQKLTKIKTKKAIIQKALELLVSLESQKGLLSFWGKVEIDDEAYR